jgi:hypothetical protein
MRRTLFALFALAAFAACTPGVGENGECIPNEGQCQVNLDCISVLPDGGSLCKYICATGGANCPRSTDVCTSEGYCSSDGGIY